MLVVAANWAISDGTLVAHPRRRQDAWLAAVHRAAIRAGWNGDGGYRPIAALDIVLAGDTFDGLTTARWSGDIRPWQRDSRAADVSRSARLGALRRGRWLLAGLRRWSRAGLPVPGVDRRGRPVPRLDDRVPVRVTCLAGDRDHWIDSVGSLAGRHGFTVGTSWTDGLVSVWHGAALDPLCGGAGDRQHAVSERIGSAEGRPTLADTVAVGLVSRFGRGLTVLPGAWPLGRSLVGQLACGLPAEMPRIVDRWLTRAIEQGQVSTTTASAITRCWRAAVSAWVKEARAAEPRCGYEVDGLAMVAAALAADEGPRSPANAAEARVFVPRWRNDRESAEAVIECPVAGGPAVVLVGHPVDFGPRSSAAAGNRPRLVSIAGLRSGPVTVCCQRHRDVLRLELLDDADGGTSAAGVFTCGPSGGDDDRIVDAA